MTTIEDEIYEAAEQGAKFMDGKRPEWFQKIDLTNLSMRHRYRCIFGQLYGNYRSNRTPLNTTMDVTEPSRLGFTLPLSCWKIDQEGHWAEADKLPQHWATLTAAWTFQIEKRLADAGQLG